MWAENHTIDDRVEQQRWPPLSSRQNVGQCILPPLDLSPWWFSTAQSSVCSTLLLVAYRNGNHYLLLFTALCTFNSISVINWIKLFTVNWIFFLCYQNCTNCGFLELFVNSLILHQWKWNKNHSPFKGIFARWITIGTEYFHSFMSFKAALNG